MKSLPTKQDEGKERNDAWRALSTQDKIASLDQRLGVGVGAKRQRAKFAAELVTPVPIHPLRAAQDVPRDPKQFASKSEEKRVRYMQQAIKKSA